MKTAEEIIDKYTIKNQVGIVKVWRSDALLAMEEYAQAKTEALQQLIESQQQTNQAMGKRLLAIEKVFSTKQDEYMMLQNIMEILNPPQKLQEGER